MRQSAVLTIDLGTTVLKTTLFDRRCHALDRIETPHAVAGGDRAAAVRRWWTLVEESVRELRRRHSDVEIAAIGLTGYMHDVVALDAGGESLCFEPGRPRARDCFDRMIERFGAKFLYELTGSRMDVTSVPCQLAAWREEAPREFERTRMILPVKDYLRYRLTGEFATDPIDACGTMFHDVFQERWDQSLLSWCGLDVAQMPPVLGCTSIAGRLTDAAAGALGLPAGIPVAVGGGDDIEILGSGATGPAQICEHVGTTGSFLVSTQVPRLDTHLAIEVYPSVVSGEWISGASCSNVAKAFDWYLAQSSYSCRGTVDWTRAREDLDRALPRIGEDSPLFLPYLAGERAPWWNPDLRSAWIGMRAHHGPDALLASVVEGICFSLRALFDAFLSIGLPIQEVYSSGGLNRVDTLRLRASLYGIPIRLAQDCDPTSFAAAALALAAIREIGNPWEASAWLQFIDPVLPDGDWQSRFGERYERFICATQDMTRANLTSTISAVP